MICALCSMLFRQSTTPKAMGGGLGFGWQSVATTLCCMALVPASSLAQSTAIYVMQTDGSGARKVAEVTGFSRVGHPRWSHDGKRLAFHAWGGPAGVRRVFIVSARASQAPESGPEGQFPDWSPDGGVKEARQLPGVRKS